MAKGGNTLTYLALAAAAYWFYTRQDSAAPLLPASAVVPVAPVQVGVTPGVRQPFLKPSLRLPKLNQTITLAQGDKLPAAPAGYYWARATVGNPPEDGSATYTLLHYEYMTQKPSAVV